MRFDLVVRVAGIFTAALALAGAGTGCSISLDTAPPLAVDAGADALVELVGCAPLRGAASRVTGRLDSVTLAEGSLLIVAGAATVGGDTDAFLFGAAAPGAAGACLENAAVVPAPLVLGTPLDPAAHTRPLAGLTSPDGITSLYFESLHADGLGSDGLGVARWDGAARRFGAPVLLWTADRPSFGSGVGFDGTFVYVIGGRAGGFLSSDMFVARVPPDRLAIAGAYEYAQGGGAWGPDADGAGPFAEGGTSPSLAFYPERARWLLAYATPLGGEVTLRSGLGPAGPWSLPVKLGRCAVPETDPEAFCADVVLHPALSPPAGQPPAGGAADEIVLSYGVGTFSATADTFAPAYETRLVRAPWPPALP